MKKGLFRKGLVLGIIVLFVGAGVLSSTGHIIKKTSTKSLGTRGYIQDLIDNASPGDTINIPSGTYYENIIINKSINLVGEDKETTIIDGGGNGDVVYISANWVNISGFTIQNSGDGWDDAGIDIRSKNNNITGNTISSNNGYGIYLGYYSSGSNITGNTISLNNHDGIKLEDSSGSNITGNTISSNNGYGIRLLYSSSNSIIGNSFYNDGLVIDDDYIYYYSNNNIANNTVNGKPLVYLEDESDEIIIDAGQVVLVNCTDITVENLNLSNTDIGIVLYDSSSSTIRNNTISKNLIGIKLYHSGLNNITGNIISENDDYGLFFGEEANRNKIDNNIISDSNCGLILNYGFSWYPPNDNIIINNSFYNTGLIDEVALKHNIVLNNTVNDKPLIYLRNEANKYIQNAGQIILRSCNNITIENQDLSNTTTGLYTHWIGNCLFQNNTITSNHRTGILIHGDNNKIIRNIITNNNHDGIYGVGNNNNIIDNKIISNNGSGILLNGINNTIYGNDITSNHQDGINLIWECVNSSITNNNISNNKNGILVEYPGESQCLTITSNTITNNNQHGLSLYVYWCNISSNIITGNNKSGIVLDGHHNTINGNTITNNKDGIDIDGYSDLNNITENIISNNEEGGISIDYNSRYNTIMHNDIYNNGEYGINVNYGCNENEIIVNNISSHCVGISISSYSQYYYSNNNKIIGNNISNNDVGIYIANYASKNIIDTNTILKNKILGIFLINSDDNNLINNDIDSNTEEGILLNNSHNNSILGNSITDNEDGIELIDSDNNIISENIISGNSDFGIEFHASSKEDCTNNTIILNHIRLNYRGIYLYNSNNCTVLKNNFLRNKRSALFYNCRSIWSQNYWNRFRLLPKLIFGKMNLGYLTIPGVNIDWHPAKKPYDIGV